MVLIYSFSTKIGNYNDLDYIFDFYKASMIRSKKLGYDIKLYGCKTTLGVLSEYVDLVVDITDKDFILTDDLKIYIHSIEDLDCITIDGDLILESDVTCNDEYDILCDRRGWINKTKGENPFKTNLKIFKEYDLSGIKHYDVKHPCSFNMGILKFNSIDLKNICIEEYYKFREIYLTQIYPLNKESLGFDPAIIVCEHLFSSITDTLNYKPVFLGECAQYTHYLSKTKYYKSSKKHIDSILRKNKSII